MKLTSLEVMTLICNGVLTLGLSYLAMIAPRIVSEMDVKNTMPEPFRTFYKKNFRRMSIIGAICGAIAMLLQLW